MTVRRRPAFDPKMVPNSPEELAVALRFLAAPIDKCSRFVGHKKEDGQEYAAQFAKCSNELIGVLCWVKKEFASERNTAVAQRWLDASVLVTVKSADVQGTTGRLTVEGIINRCALGDIEEIQLASCNDPKTLNALPGGTYLKNQGKGSDWRLGKTRVVVEPV